MKCKTHCAAKSSREDALRIDASRNEALADHVEAKTVPAKQMPTKSRVLLPKVLAHLPTTVQSGFFTDLQRHWKNPPTMAAPVTQLCTASQFDEADYSRICAMMKAVPRLHRKQWEFVYIIRCIERAGLIGRGRRGLVFGVGREKLPSLFTTRGCEITATDIPAAESKGHWADGDQHSMSLDSIFYPAIVNRKVFYANAVFRPVNMNDIPADLADFDFCWSACALEHLGTLQKGLDFILNSLNCLRPGGLAVHTTEFNLGSECETLKTGPCVVYRESDIVNFSEHLKSLGHEVCLNLNPGDKPADFMIDRDRNSDIHLRLYVAHKILATSGGLCIRKGIAA